MKQPLSGIALLSLLFVPSSFVSSSPSPASSLACGLPLCPLGVLSSSGNCTTEYESAVACLGSIKFDGEWRDNTVNVLLSSLENYGLSSITRNSGPPYFLATNVISLINDTLHVNTYSSDWEFQEDIQAALTSLHDAHTRYNKPLCYDAIQVMPFIFDVSLDAVNGSSNTNARNMIFTASKSVYYDAYIRQYPNLTQAVNSLLNQEIIRINNLEVLTAVSDWANLYETRSNDVSIRMNAGIRSYLYRSLRSYNLLPESGLAFTLSNSNTITLPWLISYSSNFANKSACVAAKHSLLNDNIHSNAHVSLSRHLLTTLDAHAAPQLHSPSLNSSDRVTIIDVGASNSTISCFIQSSHHHRKTVVMKIGSFAPPDYYMNAWTLFINDAITCLSAANGEYESLIIDVSGNGGGYVCLGLRLLTLIFKDFNEDHTRVLMTYDLPHSSFMDTYISKVNHNNPYINPQDVEEILNPLTMQPFKDGKEYYYPGKIKTYGGVTKTYTNEFVLDCKQAFDIRSDFKAPSRLKSKAHITIITDGTCGSTCASFTKIAQEANVATFVGTGGIWYQPMDISSFAGGFVCNPGYLNTLAHLFNSSFPQFVMSITWQFDWAVWYSKLQPGRPMQFTQSPPDVRVPFWSFPHPSAPTQHTSQAVSDLYDATVADAWERIEAERRHNRHHSQGWEYAAIGGFVVAGIAVLVALYFWWKKSRSSNLASGDGYAPMNA